MSRHKKWIRVCIKHALKSPVYRYKHGSLVIKGGKVISIGVNKNKKGCLGHHCYDVHKGWHSELDALHKLSPDNIRGSILYVGGISRSGNILNSKPCKYCQKYLQQFELKAIYYSTPSLEVEKLVV